MEWGQVITIIFGVAGFMGIFMFLINKGVGSVEKRIDDLNNRVDRLEDSMNRRFDRLEGEMGEIRELLYRVLGDLPRKDHENTSIRDS